jgi:uncharacterized membrane protein YqjE
MNTSRVDDASLTELLAETLSEGRELVRVEIALAKDEALGELARAKRAAVLLGLALVLATVALVVLVVALVLALGGGAAVIVSVGGGFLLAAVVAGALGAKALPVGVLSKTKARVESDVQRIKEAIA